MWTKLDCVCISITLIFEAENVIFVSGELSDKSVIPEAFNVNQSSMIGVSISEAKLVLNFMGQKVSTLCLHGQIF